MVETMVASIEATDSIQEPKEAEIALAELLPALQRLDQRLGQAVEGAAELFGPTAAHDLYRGLYVHRHEAEQLLKRAAGASHFPLAGTESLPEAATAGSRLEWLQQAFALSAFDMDVLLIALAPELDRRYERIYAYLQDHVSRRRPSVDLALHLLCTNAGERLARRLHLDVGAPLISNYLIHLLPEAGQDQPSLLAHTLKVDEQITRFLLYQDGLDTRLASFCRIEVDDVYLADLPLDAEIKQALTTLTRQAWNYDEPLHLYFCGPPGVGKRQTAAALATEVGASLLVADLRQALTVTTEAKIETAQLWTFLLRAAWFENAILYVEGSDTLRSETYAMALRQLVDALAAHRNIVILAGTQPWTPTGHTTSIIPVTFAIPRFDQRRACWQNQLALTGLSLGEEAGSALAGRFYLTSGQIAEAVTTAWNHARWRAASAVEQGPGYPTLADLLAAARAQSGHDLAALAHKVAPQYTWADLVLPDDALSRLREMCQQVAYRHQVLGEWGFDAKLSQGKGVNALFAGPSGTGKSMAAEIIANELGLDLYKIDLAGVVSKYIGETEKNLDHIFSAAENANAILFFDEADALFGKRSEVRDSHDRYANIEISYLLQKIEHYQGVAILATNLRANLDEAFVRRLAFTIHFPFPDEESRLRIWRGIWPERVPLAKDVSLDFLATHFKLSGGNIKNVALAAAFLAAAEDSSVTMSHLLKATRREYQKLGKQLSEAELNAPSNHTQPARRAQ
jgi:SpoVK/Ycf46/Vps4 family AAA+-type ATPase